VANAWLNKLSDNGAAVPLNETLVRRGAPSSTSDDGRYALMIPAILLLIILPRSRGPLLEGLSRLLFSRKREARFIFKPLSLMNLRDYVKARGRASPIKGH